MFLEYKNSLGSVIMSGDSGSDVRIREVDGLGTAQRQYMTAVFADYDGQETLGNKALPRCITLGIEICGRNISERTKEILRILSREGYLAVGEDKGERRIYCNQSTITPIQRVLKGEIATLGVQFICDNPYFEDAEACVYSVYRRTKELSTPFSMPCVLGRTYSVAEIVNNGDVPSQPVIRLVCPNTLDNAETLVISNLTTAKKISLSFTPQAGEELIIDVPNRKVKSNLNGDMLNCLTDDSFLGEFNLVPGANRLQVAVGSLENGFTVECTCGGVYSEAVIV